MKKNTKTHRLMNQTDRQIRQQRLPKCLAVTDATGRDPLKAVVGGVEKEFLLSLWQHSGCD